MKKRTNKIDVDLSSFFSLLFQMLHLLVLFLLFPKNFRLLLFLFMLLYFGNFPHIYMQALEKQMKHTLRKKKEIDDEQ
jgi:hypothetical protein